MLSARGLTLRREETIVAAERSMFVLMYRLGVFFSQ